MVDENKDQQPAPPTEILPENEGVKVDDEAEPNNAEVDHSASQEEVEEEVR